MSKIWMQNKEKNKQKLVSQKDYHQHLIEGWTKLEFTRIKTADDMNGVKKEKKGAYHKIF